MPTIEITQAQADALARGEHISVAPPPPPDKRYVVTFSSGNTYLFTSSDQDLAGVYPTDFKAPGFATLIDKGPHFEKIGYIQHQPSAVGNGATVVEVPFHA